MKESDKPPMIVQLVMDVTGALACFIGWHKWHSEEPNNIAVERTCLRCKKHIEAIDWTRE